MLKLKMLINVLLFLTISLCLHPVDTSNAGDCSDKGAGVETPTVTGNYNYAPGHTCTKDPDMEYDTANSNETIARNGTTNLVVIGNNGPYTWSVSGEGFWFDASNTITSIQTNDITTTLYADGTACGAATITVSGCDGTEVTGYVRCTAGTWELTESCDGRFEPICSGWSCSSANIIIGKNLYIVGWNVCDQDLFPDCCADPLITGCGHCPDGDAFMEYCEENRCAPCCDCNDICFSTYFQAYEWRCN